MPLPPAARVGLYGKLPARGDFVREALPRDFVEAWDAWWQRGIAGTQQRPADEWRDAWLEAPVWRFVLPPGLCGANGVLGLWMPSVDKAGRYFPLTIAATAASDWAPLVGPLTAFLDAAEEAGRDALEQDLAPDELLARLQHAFVVGAASDAPPEPVAGEATDAPPEPVVGEASDAPPEPVAGEATWWTDGGPRVAARLERTRELPEGPRFAALIDDAWREAQPAPTPTADQQAEHP